MSDRATRILGEMRANGHRVTAAREAIVQVLTANAGHLSAADVSAAVQADHPDVHQATVYRTLDRLVELGVVDHIHLAHGAAVYHLADDHHIHAVCEACGTVYDTPGSVLAPAARRLLADHGFELTLGHVALSGRCRNCADAAHNHSHAR
jgi:Fe2+ or Zn2+ uptake regulation protein